MRTAVKHQHSRGQITGWRQWFNQSLTDRTVILRLLIITSKPGRANIIILYNNMIKCQIKFWHLIRIYVLIKCQKKLEKCLLVSFVFLSWCSVYCRNQVLLKYSTALGLCVCVCVCVCNRGRKRDVDRKVWYTGQPAALWVQGSCSDDCQLESRDRQSCGVDQAPKTPPTPGRRKVKPNAPVCPVPNSEVFWDRLKAEVKFSCVHHRFNSKSSAGLFSPLIIA